MIRFVFGVEDLARLRFAISPMWELTRSLLAMREPSYAALHLPWLRGLSGRLDGLDLRQVAALVHPRGYSPDFVVPPPAGPLAELAEDLRAIRRTPPDRIRFEIAIVRREQPKLARLLRAWEDDPAGQAAAIADTLEAYWERAVEPVWPRLRALLDADLAHRARRLTEGGANALFSDLHHMVRWRENVLEMESATYHTTVELEGRGLLLIPSAFAWDRPYGITSDYWQPTLAYPARGVATLWETGDATPAGLARVLGTSRAALLAALDAPRSTTELAERLGMTPGGASQHLGALREAGLVAGRREGRFVLYVRTPAADALVGA